MKKHFKITHSYSKTAELERDIINSRILRYFEYQKYLSFYIVVNWFIVKRLRIHWRLSTILKTRKKLYEVTFFDIWKYVYSESVFDTLYIEIKHKC